MSIMEAEAYHKMKILKILCSINLSLGKMEVFL